MATEPDTNSPVKAATIKRLRESMGWKQKDLERAADVSMATVQRAERGDPSLKASTVKQLADALGVSLSAVYDVEDAPERTGLADQPAWAQAMEARLDERARLRHDELLAALRSLDTGIRANSTAVEHVHRDILDGFAGRLSNGEA